jgi:hypothetical protein
MADLLETFDPNSVPEDDRNFDPIPAGDYDMQCIESEIKDTKDGTGQMLVLTHEIISGPHANRRIWDRLNIRNQNADAQRIAQRALADLCLAVGLGAIRDSEELHFKPFVGRVAIRQDKSGQYGPQNTVRYKARAGGAPAAGKAAPRPAAQQPAQQTAQPATGAKPWKRAS